jgi:hypothetical protein
MRVVRLVGSPIEETESGLVVIEGTENVRDEGRGKCDEEFVAEGIEI